MKKQIVHFFHSHDKMGLGDFIRGSLALAQVEDAELVLDFSRGPFQEFLDTKTNEQKNLINIYLKRPLRFIAKHFKSNTETSTLCISTNSFPEKQLTQHHIEKFLNAFQYRVAFKKELEDTIASLPADYVAVHVRLGDHYEKSFRSDYRSEKRRKDETYHELERRIRRILVQDNCFERAILISDNKSFKEYMSKLGYSTSGGVPIHTGWVASEFFYDDFKTQQVKDTLTDFHILCKSKKIYQYSYYVWGSGFSDIAGCLYNVPVCHLISPYRKFLNRCKRVRLLSIIEAEQFFYEHSYLLAPEAQGRAGLRNRFHIFKAHLKTAKNNYNRFKNLLSFARDSFLLTTVRIIMEMLTLLKFFTLHDPYKFLKNVKR